MQSGDHVAGTFDTGPQVKIFSLQVEHPSRDSVHLVAGHHTILGLETLQFALRLEAPPPPTGELVGQVPKHPLEIGDRRDVRTYVW